MCSPARVAAQNDRRQAPGMAHALPLGGGMRMTKAKVADLLVDVLAEAGVRQIYGVAGDSLNGITDAIRATERVRWIHVRHEETAAFAAGAEAHLTGRLAACPGLSGPGNLHLTNSLYAS